MFNVKSKVNANIMVCTFCSLQLYSLTYVLFVKGEYSKKSTIIIVVVGN